jgi:hypothetical protein
MGRRERWLILLLALSSLLTTGLVVAYRWLGW